MQQAMDQHSAVVPVLSRNTRRPRKKENVWHERGGWGQDAIVETSG